MSPADPKRKDDADSVLLLRTVDQAYSVVEGGHSWPVFQQTLLELLAMLDADSESGTPAQDITQLASLLLRHFTRALRQQDAQFDQQSLIEFQDGLLDQHHLAIALCGSDASVQWANLRMREYLLALSAAQLQLLCSPVTRRPVSITLSLPQGVVSVLAVDATEAGVGRVTLLASPPGARQLDLASLRTLFGLTETESRIAQRMVLGEAAEQIAAANGTSVHTVRTQIKQLLGKVGVNRQSELVAALVTSPASIDLGGMPLVTVPPALFVRIGTRRLAYADYGPRDGRPVIFMHSWAGSRLQLPPDPHSLFKYGIRLLIPERPGVGKSDPPSSPDDSPRQCLDQWSEDVRAFADELGLKKFDVVGYSLGCVFALATARHLGDRVGRVTLVSPIAPLRSAQDIKEMLPGARALFGVAMHLPKVLPVAMALWLGWLRRRPAMYFESVRPYLAPADALILETPYMRAHYESIFMESISAGNAALVREVLVMVSDWTDRIPLQQPVTIWHGDTDNHVPLPHAQRLQASLPGSRLICVPDAGHYLVYRHWPGILEQLT